MLPPNGCQVPIQDVLDVSRVEDVERDLARFEWAVLDWNAPSIAFYQSVGAQVMDAWKICRLSGAALASFASGTPS